MISRMKQNRSLRTSKRYGEKKAGAKFRVNEKNWKIQVKDYSPEHLKYTKKIFQERLKRQKRRATLIWVIISDLVLASLIVFALWINRSLQI